MNESPLESLEIENKLKLNILVAHLDLNGAKDKEGFSYNPILESKLAEKGFDYIACGHVHKRTVQSNNNIYYPGSTISLGFDELGEHGIIVRRNYKRELKYKFCKIR